MYMQVEERVDRLEDILGQFIVQTNLSLSRLEREMRAFKDEMRLFKGEMRGFKDEMKDFKDEMKDFKDEMRDFKDGMTVFKDEMRDFKDGMTVFKDEMTVFKDEMTVFKDEVRQDQKARNKQWGELANKMGTLVEDLIEPAVRPTVKKFFHSDIQDFAIHVKRKRKDLNLEGEFDVIAVTDANQVVLIEVKSSPSKEYLAEFLQKIDTFTRLFPEHAGKQLIPIFAGLRLEEHLIPLATQHRVYVMAYREWDYLDLLNFDDVQQAERAVRAEDAQEARC